MKTPKYLSSETHEKDDHPGLIYLRNLHYDEDLFANSTISL